MKIIRINAMWCGGCLSMHKIWDKISKEYPNIEIINYDYDMDEDIVKEYNVGTLLPVAIFFDKEEEVARLNGEKTFEEIKETINNYK
ncbi:MAG: thioredoxin family protein [Bacilli bacterium]|nr:thioredoxin family protein [Bacilli bacterium]